MFSKSKKGKEVKSILMVVFCFMAGVSFGIDEKILKAIAIKESSNKTGVIGDLSFKYHSYGKYQIRQGYLDDVLKLYNKECKAVFGKSKPTLKDVQWNDALGKWVVGKYLSIYGKKYEKDTGLKLTPEVAFMIHNGGPNGWKKGTKVNKSAKQYAISTMRLYRSV